jgi:hypothetical protein
LVALNAANIRSVYLPADIIFPERLDTPFKANLIACASRPNLNGRGELFQLVFERTNVKLRENFLYHRRKYPKSQRGFPVKPRRVLAYIQAVWRVSDAVLSRHLILAYVKLRIPAGSVRLMAGGWNPRYSQSSGA